MKLRRKTYLVVAVAMVAMAASYWYSRPVSKVTPVNIMKLKYGMTAQEVLDILGPSIDMKVYQLDTGVTYKEGFESFVALRYLLKAPDRPDLPAYRVLHPCKDGTALETTPLLSSHIFIGKDYAVFVTISPYNKLFRASVYPIITEGGGTLAYLEYQFDKLVGNYRPPANAPLPVMAPPPLPPDFGRNNMPNQDVPSVIAEPAAPKK